MGELVEVCDEDYAQEGILKSVDVEGIPLMITKINKRIIITSRVCSHKTYDLTKGHYAEGYVTCLLHTSVFDLEDGEPQNPPAIDPLDVYDAKIFNKKIYIEI